MSVESAPQPLVVGRYVLEREIGAGGMGSVYFGRMHAAAGFEKVVAIKRLHPQYAKDAAFRAALMDEARLAGRISHANVIQILDVVVHDGEFLVVMELLRGENLSQLMALAAGPLPPDIATKIALDVLAGLHAAHEVRDEQGQSLEIVHRDVSPQNVIVGTDGISRLIDFGVAKAVGRMQQTIDGQLKGKIGYFAPETIRNGQVDRRVDVYAVGVLLWEMLTGSFLFRGQNELQIMAAILAGATRAPSTSVPGIAPELDRAVMRALANDPDARFPTAEAMAEELDNAMVPARTRRVGEWVRQTAEQTLADREQVLSELAGTKVVAYSAVNRRPELVEVAATEPGFPPSEAVSTIPEPIHTTLESAGAGGAPTAPETPAVRRASPESAPTLAETPAARDVATTRRNPASNLQASSVPETQPELPVPTPRKRRTPAFALAITLLLVGIVLAGAWAYHALNAPP